MSEKLELATIEKQEVAVRPQPSTAEILQAVLASGVTQENVEVVRAIVELKERDEARQAERDFNSAFVRLRQKIPKIKATKPVPAKDGSVKYYYAPLEEIDAQASPLCLEEGFTYAFSEPETAPVPGKIAKVCTLFHIGGHKRSNTYTVRIGQGPPHASESQSDASAHSFAKRGALCDCLGIVIAHQDNDARVEGDVISPEQAEELERRVKMLNRDPKKFLAFAHAQTFAAISEGAYPILDDYLTKLEKGPQP